MILEQLTIRRNESYETNPGSYRGEIKFKNQYGEIKLHLNEETSKKILAVVAEQMVISSRELATNLTANCIEAISTDKQLTLDKSTDPE